MTEGFDDMKRVGRRKHENTGPLHVLSLQYSLPRGVID